MDSPEAFLQWGWATPRRVIILMEKAAQNNEFNRKPWCPVMRGEYKCTGCLFLGLTCCSRPAALSSGVCGKKESQEHPDSHHNQDTGRGAELGGHQRSSSGLQQKPEQL